MWPVTGRPDNTVMYVIMVGTELMKLGSRFVGLNRDVIYLDVHFLLVNNSDSSMFDVPFLKQQFVP